jgi:hypothetical protein
MRLGLNIGIGKVRKAAVLNYQLPILPAYAAVLEAMTVKPSESDQVAQNKMMSGLDSLNVLSRCEFVDVWATHDRQSAKLNWVNPGTFDPTEVNTPVFDAYEGFKGVSATNSCLKLNFNPSTQATKVGQDDACAIIGVGDDLDEENAVDFGSTRFRINAKKTSVNGYETSLSEFYTNGNWNSNTKKHYAISRNNGANYDIYINRSKFNVEHATNTVSSGLGTDMYACAFGYLGSPSNYNNKHLRYAIVCSYLTPAEVRAVMDIMEEYLQAVGTGLVATPRINLAIEGHSFMTISNSYTRIGHKIADSLNIVQNNNNAVNGSTIAGAVSRSAALDAMLDASHDNYLVVWLGVNEIDNTVGSGQAAYDALKPYIQARLTAGWDKILVYTCTPATLSGRGAGSQFETVERHIFNDNLRDDLSLLNGVYILDTDTVSELDDPTNTTYYSDGLHLTPDGGDLVSAQLALGKINLLNV